MLEKCPFLGWSSSDLNHGFKHGVSSILAAHTQSTLFLGVCAERHGMPGAALMVRLEGARVLKADPKSRNVFPTTIPKTDGTCRRRQSAMSHKW